MTAASQAPSVLPVAAAAGAARLTIHRLDLDCAVAAPAAAAQAFGRRLEQTARQRLPGALAEALAGLDRGGDGVLLLRRLELDLELDRGLEPAALARRWALAMTDALARLLDDRSGAERHGSGLVRFADRRHWLARFVVDLVAGQAWQGWLHRPFDGLRALPLSAALRTALAEQPADGLAALLLLDDAERLRLISALTPGDAQRLLQTLAADRHDAPLAAGVSALLPALAQGSPQRQLAETDPERGALALWLAALHRSPAGGGQQPATLARALAELIGTASQDSARARALLDQLRQGDLVGIASNGDSASTLLLNPLCALAPSARAALLDALSPSAVARPRAASSETRWTRFGNAFVLLPVIGELPLELLTADWPAPVADTALAMLRWAVLAAAQGRERRGACLRDPLVADLCGIAPRTTDADLARWLDAIDRRTLAGARRRLLDELLAEPTPTQIADLGVPAVTDRGPAVPSAAPGRRVLLEARRGCWLWLLDACEPLPSGLADPVPADAKRCAAVAADLAFLAGEPAGDENSAGELFAIQLAQILLKRLAYRLPGFADSSAGYLHRNFLGMDARLCVEQDRIAVSLGTVPLQMILGITGADRRVLSLPWMSPLPVHLRRDGQG